VINHVFGEMDRTARSSLDRKNDLAEILSVDGFVGIRAGRLQGMVTGTRKCHAALFGGMAQHDPTLTGIAGAGMEHPSGKDGCLPRILPIDAGARLVGHHLRRNHNRRLCVENRHTIGDSRHMPMNEGDQTPGGDLHQFA